MKAQYPVPVFWSSTQFASRCKASGFIVVVAGVVVVVVGTVVVVVVETVVVVLVGIVVVRKLKAECGSWSLWREVEVVERGHRFH